MSLKKLSSEWSLVEKLCNDNTVCTLPKTIKSVLILIGCYVLIHIFDELIEATLLEITKSLQN